MKKIISVALIVAMCATMMLMPTVASAAVTAKVSVGSTVVDCIAGSYNAGSGSGYGEKGYNVVIESTDSDNKWNFSDSRYIVLDLNFMPTNELKGVFAGPNAGLFTIGSKDFNVGRWNHARVVLEEQDKDTMKNNNKYQPMTLYINGVKIGTKQCGMNTGDLVVGGASPYSQGFRFTLGGANGANVGKVADAVLSESNTDAAPVMPYLVVDGKCVTVGSEFFPYSDDIAVSELKASRGDFEVEVYAATDTAFSTPLEDSHKLVVGDVVLVKDNTNKRYAYYTVTANDKKIIKNIPDGTTTGLDMGNHVTVSKEDNGFAGKSGPVVKLTQCTTETNNTYFDVTGATLMSTNTLEYAVLQFNIFPGNYDFTICTEQTFAMFSDADYTLIKNATEKNAWNKVTLVMKNGSTDANKQQRETVYSTYQEGNSQTGVHTADVYINNKKIVSDCDTKAWGFKWISGSQRNATRFRIMCNLPATGESAYIDDVYLYETNKYNEADFTQPMPSVSIANAAKGFIDGKSIVIENGASLAKVDIAPSEGCSISVYEDNTYATLNTSGTITNGNVVCVTDGDGKAVTAYTVIELAEKYDLITTTPSFALNGGTTEAVSGEILGKASDELKKVTIGDANNYHNLVWTEGKYGSKYVVYTLDIAPMTGIEYIIFGTNSHSPMVTTAYIGKQLRKNRWNDIKFIYNIADNTADLYVNNILVRDDFKSSFKSGTNNCIRFIIGGANGSVAYVDNMRAFEWTSSDYPVNDVDGTCIYDNTSYANLNTGWTKATVSELKPGVHGNDDTAVMVKNKPEAGSKDVFVSYTWNDEYFGNEKYVVYIADVRFGPNGDYFKFGTNQHGSISSDIKSTNPKIKDGWNRITAVSDATTGATKVYINGIYDSDHTSELKKGAGKDVLRLIAYAKDSADTENEVISLDNVYVYRANTELTFDAPVTGSYSADKGATYTADCGYGTLLVAAYNGDDMIEAKYINVTADNKTLTLKSEGATEYRAFIWDSIDGIKPMYDFIPVPVAN